MDTELSPLTLANHWPFLRRQLILNRWPNGVTALGLLSQLQVEAGGEGISLGRSRIEAECESAGQAGGIWRALVELESRRVLARRRGAGRLADSWTLRADISHWRRMPWKESGRATQRAIVGCEICRAACAEAAFLPGQRVSLLRGNAEFRISSADHLFPPGTLPVDTRGNGADRAATAQAPAWGPVDARGNGATPRAPTALFQEVELLELGEAERDRFTKLKGLVDFHCEPGYFVRPGTTIEKTLVRLACELTDGEARALQSHFDKTAGKGLAPGQVSKMERMAVGILAKSRGRALAQA